MIWLEIHHPVCVVIERATSVLFELEHAYSMIPYGFTLTIITGCVLERIGTQRNKNLK
jgi:hypothetical protein